MASNAGVYFGGMTRSALDNLIQCRHPDSKRRQTHLKLRRFRRRGTTLLVGTSVRFAPLALRSAA
jgi:hypothetical protein